MMCGSVSSAVPWDTTGVCGSAVGAHTDAEVGFFNIAFALAFYPMLLLPGALSGVLLPAMSEQFGKRDLVQLGRIYVTSARYVLALTLPLVS